LNLNHVDVSSCEREPIHIPGSIQPHGLLLVVDRASGRVTHVAGDVEGRLGVCDWQGAHLEALLGSEAAQAVLAPETPALRHVVPPRSETAFDISVLRGAQEYLVELEPAADGPLMSTLLPGLEAAARAFEEASDLPELMASAAREFRRLTGYDRVMIYRFLDDDAGKVVGEDAAPGQHSFMNHHFPASDIPAQARALYIRNLVRVIPDVNYRSAPIRPERPAEDPLDMSDCNLRSVSPVHIQYLKNMGVAASASFSIVKDNVLWGLIASHNSEPRQLTIDVRTACRALAAGLARQIKSREETNAYRERVRLRSFEDRIIDLLLREGSLEVALSRHLHEVQTMLAADGLAVLRGDDMVTAGRCPEAEEIRALAEWVGKKPRSVFATSELAGTDAPRSAVSPLSAGLLAMILSRSEQWMVLWVRAEAVEVVNWAGNPHKAASLGPNGELTPRASFEAWSETVRGKARRWSVAEVEAAEHLATAIQNVWQTRRIQDLNRELLSLVEQKEALLKQREFLLGEVNHRVQNSLTLVSSFLAMQARESGDERTRQAIDEARRRISAVSLVHRRLYGSDQVRTVDGARYVEELLDDLLASMDQAWRGHLTRDLEPVLLPNDRAISLGLILTELVINTHKYAYDGGAGPLQVTLTEHGNMFRLMVADRGKGRESSGAGFGSRMMDALVRQLGGTLEFSNNRPGTRAVLSARTEG
jgi:chemotaxis family two-component system sensor kinase Cph1